MARPAARPRQFDALPVAAEDGCRLRWPDVILGLKVRRRERSDDRHAQLAQSLGIFSISDVIAKVVAHASQTREPSSGSTSPEASAELGRR
jgi:hypothetical protein